MNSNQSPIVLREKSMSLLKSLNMKRVSSSLSRSKSDRPSKSYLNARRTLTPRSKTLNGITKVNCTLTRNLLILKRRNCKSNRKETWQRSRLNKLPSILLKPRMNNVRERLMSYVRNLRVAIMSVLNTLNK